MNESTRTFSGHRPDLGERVWIDPAAVVIGKVVLGDDVSVWPGAVLRGDVNRIAVGPRTNIQDGAVCHVTHDGPYTPGGYPLVIGPDVTVGHGAILHACRIGHACLIGMGATVLDGAILADRVMLAAGSLVAPGHELESGYLYRGSPARKARALTDTELEALEYSARHYVALKDRYRKKT